MRINSTIWRFSVAIFAAFSGLSARAQDGIEGLEVIGAPVPGGTGFQPAATELARDLFGLDWLILIIITGIVGLVLALMGYIIVRYNRRANATPASFTHNAPLEVTWTIGPIVILVFIGAFSLPVLFKQQEIPEGDITIKVTGYQWYWGYEYVDEGFGFDAFMLGRSALERYGYTQGRIPAGHRQRRRRALWQDHRHAGDRGRCDP